MLNFFFLKNILFFQSSCSSWQYCKLSTKKCIPFLLIFFNQLVLREDIYWNRCFFNSWIYILLFLVLVTLQIAQMQYRNMGKGCERILPQDKFLLNSQKLRKVVLICKTDRLISIKYLSLKTRGSEKVP